MALLSLIALAAWLPALQEAGEPAQPTGTEAEAQADTEETAWIDPALPEEWDDSQESPRQDDWRWDADALLSVEYVDWGGRNASHSGLDTQQASVIVTARHGEDFLLWIEPDFDGEDSRHNLWEAWGEWTLTPESWLRVGQQKVSLGTEFETRSEDLTFVGYAFPAWLYGRYDFGLRYDAYAGANLWWAALGTAGEGFDLDGERRTNPLFMLRGALIPAVPEGSGRGCFEGLFGGAAIAYSPDGDDHVLQATPLEQTTLITDDLDGEAEQFVQWELGTRLGPFRAGLENVVGSITDVPSGGGTNDMEELTAWAGYAAWNFTGDAPCWVRGGWAPYTRADQLAGKALPVELAFRYSNSDIDRDLFNFGLTTYNPSSQETRSLSTALSAHISPDTRLALEWLYIIADHELTVFDGEGRTSNVVLRVDHWFGR